MRNSIFIILCVLLFQFSCTKKIDTAENIIKYLKNESNGLIISDLQTNKISYTLMYRPTELIALHELKGIKDINKVVVDSVSTKYKPYQYYLLKIAFNNQDVLAGYSNAELSNELVFHLDRYVKLVTDKDTLNLLDYSCPRLYGMTKTTEFLLCFEDTQKSSNIRCLLIEPVANIINATRLCLKTSSIESAPKINLYKELNIID